MESSCRSSIPEDLGLIPKSVEGGKKLIKIHKQQEVQSRIKSNVPCTMGISPASEEIKKAKSAEC